MKWSPCIDILCRHGSNVTPVQLALPPPDSASPAPSPNTHITKSIVGAIEEGCMSTIPLIQHARTGTATVRPKIDFPPFPREGRDNVAPLIVPIPAARLPHSLHHRLVLPSPHAVSSGAALATYCVPQHRVKAANLEAARRMFHSSLDMTGRAGGLVWVVVPLFTIWNGFVEELSVLGGECSG